MLLCNTHTLNLYIKFVVFPIPTDVSSVGEKSHQWGMTNITQCHFSQMTQNSIFLCFSMEAVNYGVSLSLVSGINNICSVAHVPCDKMVFA